MIKIALPNLEISPIQSSKIYQASTIIGELKIGGYRNTKMYAMYIKHELFLKDRLCSPVKENRWPHTAQKHPLNFI